MQLEWNISYPQVQVTVDWVFGLKSWAYNTSQNFPESSNTLSGQKKILILIRLHAYWLVSFTNSYIIEKNDVQSLSQIVISL